MKQWWIVLFLTLLPVAVATQRQAVDTVRAGDVTQDTLRVDDVAPPIYLRTLDGKDFFLRDYCGTLRSPRKKPRIVVFSFFATWCLPCRREIPHLMELQKRYQTNDVKIFLVNVGEEPAKVEEFLKTTGVGLPVLMDRYSVVSQKYGVQALPTLVVVGKDGIVKTIRVGYADGDEQKLDPFLKGLL